MELFATDGSDCLLIFHKSERQVTTPPYKSL